MKNTIASNYLRLLKPLRLEIKLEILSRLGESLRHDIESSPVNKESLLDNLFGAWADTADNLAYEILKDRSISKSDLSLD